jgi:pimeloyl-ACP methyl ester carboxylesterase
MALESARVRVGVDVAGAPDAAPVVLVHGSVVSRAIWRPQLRALSDAYRVIAPDLPGHGALAELPFTFHSAVESLARVIDAEARGRAVVVGLSLGGYVAIELARRHPERVAALVLCGCSRSFTGALGVYLKAVSGLMRKGWLRQSPDQLERKTRRLFPPELGDVADEQVHAGLQAGPLAGAFAEMAGRDWGAALSAFPGPVLVLNGELDAMARRGEAQLAAAARDARVQTVAGAGHACNLDRPQEFDRAVRAFLDTIGPPWSTSPRTAPLTRE